MYERGALDADHDDLNPFYYQHYYYYRKGYDEGRRRLRRADPVERPAARRTPLLVALLATIVVAAGGAWLLSSANLGERPAVAAPPTSAAPATARPTARPSPMPTAAPTDTPPPQLAVGRRARVVTQDGAPLRMRDGPGQAARLLARVPASTEVELLEGPVEADGYVWWRVRASESEGWCAARALDGSVIFLEPLP